MNNTTLTFRVAPDLKESAIKCANAIGIPLSNLINAFLVRFVNDGKVPFDLRVPEIPNEVTLASIRETQGGEGLKEYASLQDMAADLGL